MSQITFPVAHSAVPHLTSTKELNYFYCLHRRDIKYIYRNKKTDMILSKTQSFCDID